MATMKALLLDAPRPPDALQIQDLPIETHHLPHRSTPAVGRPSTVGVAAQPIQTVC
jgi:hypothetical protein